MTLGLGFVIVIVCVLGGFLLAHGNLAVLFQPSEFIIIVGAAIGGVVIGTPVRVLKEISASIKGCFVAEAVRSKNFMELLKTIYDLSSLVRTEGLLALEPHVEAPDSSSILGRLKSHHRLGLMLSDSLRMILIGAPIEEIAEVLDVDLEIIEHESEEPGTVVATVADGLPGLGIVAAVLGIIITMNSIGGESAEVGRHVAAALVGTFLGVLLAYGFVSPLASAVKNERKTEFHMYRVAKVGILGIARGSNPLLVCEAARHEIPPHNRPEMQVMEQFLKGKTA